MKICSKCKEDKDLNSFSPNKHTKDGKQSYCKPCRVILNQQYDKRTNKEKSSYQKIIKLKSKYDLTPEQKQTQIDYQNNQCAICQLELSDNISSDIHIDHNHETKKLRGILCSKCNMGIGMFKDNPIYLQAAIDYLSTNGVWKTRHA